MTEFERIQLQLQAIAQRDTISVAEAALLYGMSERWFYDRIADGDLPYYRVGGKRMFSKKDIEKYLTSVRVASQAEMRSTSTRYAMNNPSIARI